MYRNEWVGIPVLALCALLVFSLTATLDARAGPVSDIPEGVNDALFDGGNIYGAKMLLAVSIMACVLLVLAVLRMNLIGVIILMFGVMGVLTAIGWLDVWVLVFTALLIAALWGTKTARWIWPSGGGGSED